MRRHYSTEQFEVFKQEAAEDFLGQVRWKTQHFLQQMLEADSEQQMADYLGRQPYQRNEEPQDHSDSRNGFYERDYVTALGSIRMRVRRTRKRSFLPRGIKALQRRAPEVAEIIRQAFLQGVSTRAVGRVVALLTDEPVSAQTVSRLTRTLDQEVETFHHATLADDWAYLLLDGVWMKVRRAFGPQRVLLLVAYGVRANGQRQLLAFTRARAESQAAWEGFLWDLHRRGLTGRQLKLVLTDGCAGLAAAIETIYPRAQTPALLGAQDAQPARWGAPPRSTASKTRCPTHLSGPQRRAGSRRLRAISLSLANSLPRPGQTSPARLARTAHLLRLPAAAMAQAAHHQRHRALLRRGPPPHPAHGPIHQHCQRGANRLCHLF